ELGPHHAVPPCRHFGRCGGCQLQHLDEEALAGFVRDRVVNAAEGQGLAPERVAPVHLSPPNTRRRAVLRAVNGGGRPLIGFNEQGSHRVVDMRECHVLRPELFALVEPLRRMLGPRRDRYAAEITLALTDQGVDCAVKGLALEGLAQTEAMLDFCREQGLARLTLDQGYGPETFWEPDPATVTLSGVAVDYPAGAFLQATADGEAALVAAAREWLAGSDRVADLFAGLGTFAFALAGSTRVTAAEAARDAHVACRAAAGRGAGAAVGRGAAPRFVPQSATRRRAARLRRRGARPAPCRRTRTGGAAGRQRRAADRLCQLQPIELGAGRAGACRCRLPIGGA